MKFFIVFSTYENVPVVTGPSAGRLHGVFMLTSDPAEIFILGIFSSFFSLFLHHNVCKKSFSEICYAFDLNLIKIGKVPLSHAKQLSTVTVGVQWSNCDFEPVFSPGKAQKECQNILY